MARAAQAEVGAAQVGAAEVGAAEVEADHNSRVDDEGVYEYDESVASCSGSPGYSVPSRVVPPNMRMPEEKVEVAQNDP